MVIGWVSFFLFGLFYVHFGKSVRQWLAALHFALSQISLAGLIIGLWFLYAGETQFEPVAAISSIAYAVSFVVFGVVALPVVWTTR